MRKAIIPALLLVLVSVVLGATVFREQVAHAASNLNVFVTNDAAHPVPVHEQGTANVNVTNAGGRVIPVAHDVTLPTGTYLSPVVARIRPPDHGPGGHARRAGAGGTRFLFLRLSNQR